MSTRADDVGDVSDIGPDPWARLPRHLVETHVLPLLGIDARAALGVPVGRLRPSPAGTALLESCLRRRTDATFSEPGGRRRTSFPIAGTDRAFQHVTCVVLKDGQPRVARASFVVEYPDGEEDAPYPWLLWWDYGSDEDDSDWEGEDP